MASNAENVSIWWRHHVEGKDPLHNIPWLVTVWQRKEPGHQQPWCWPRLRENPDQSTRSLSPSFTVGTDGYYRRSWSSNDVMTLTHWRNLHISLEFSFRRTLNFVMMCLEQVWGTRLPYHFCHVFSVVAWLFVMVVPSYSVSWFIWISRKLGFISIRSAVYDLCK